MKRKLLTSLFILFTLTALPQKLTVVSPNNKIIIALFNNQNTDAGTLTSLFRYQIQVNEKGQK